MRTLLCLPVCVAAACVVFGQGGPPAAPPRFDIANIRPAGSGFGAPVAQFARGPFMTGPRYDLLGATLVDLITRAYDVTPDKVLDGPNWLEYDRFDITAMMPPKTSAADAKLMLRTLLTDRFGLAIRNEERPLPAYVLTAPKGKPKLKEADGTGNTGCTMALDQPRPPEPRPAEGAPGLPTPPTLAYTCRNMSMAAFADGLKGMALAQQFIGTNPVKDKTGIEGKWDFNFKYTLPIIGSADSITLPDALDRQLGLKLDQETTSIPVIVVEKAGHPSPNEPDVAAKIPAGPTEFEVATIRPFAQGPGPNIMGMQVRPGGRFEMSGLPLKLILTQAYNVQNDAIIDAPKWMDADRYNITAKIPGDAAAMPQNNAIEPESLSKMLQALLKERFKLAAHFEERPMTAYNLTAPKPKLKKADPATRTKWSDSSAAAITINGSSAPSRTVKFQNMSMAQLAEKLQALASSYIHAPVLDATGLEGSYDFTLTFSPIAPEQLASLLSNARAQANAAGAAAPASSDPMGGISLFDAIDKQLGLKLVEQKRPVRVLVIDHIEQQPTEN